MVLVGFWKVHCPNVIYYEFDHEFPRPLGNKPWGIQICFSCQNPQQNLSNCVLKLTKKTKLLTLSALGAPKGALREALGPRGVIFTTYEYLSCGIQNNLASSLKTTCGSF